MVHRVGRVRGINGQCNARTPVSAPSIRTRKALGNGLKRKGRGNHSRFALDLLPYVLPIEFRDAAYPKKHNTQG